MGAPGLVGGQRHVPHHGRRLHEYQVPTGAVGLVAVNANLSLYEDPELVTGVVLTAQGMAVLKIRDLERGEDFRQVLGEHNAALTESYRAVLGDAGAEAFANDMAGGRFMLPRVQVERVLKETRAVQMLSATSLVRNAVVRLKKGDVSPPWPSRLGYVVVRLNNARLGGLEDVYDDLEDATRTEFYETYFKLWVNETLSGSEVVIP